MNFSELGYEIPAALPDSWRTYDQTNPEPGYFEFDWLSARHPDLYHSYALTTDALVHELRGLVDLRGQVVCDVGAGTGGSAIGIGTIAAHVYAVDAYRSVIEYGIRKVAEAGLHNVEYLWGDRSALPLPDRSVDVVSCVWAELDLREANRVLRPGGLAIRMGNAPGSLCGELSGILAEEYPELITQVLPAELFRDSAPSVDTVEHTVEGIALSDGLRVYDFTRVIHYPDLDQLCSIVGRIYGPKASNYLKRKGKPSIAWRLRIQVGRKPEP
ncbi:MAG TPA: methyltransferase domain-containing protein [Chloroflexota bacterium]|nr:methyltransferase domain-containing protein [Chloroflexota bacterium]